MSSPKASSSQSTTPTQRHPHHNMLERALSSRRGTLLADDDDSSSAAAAASNGDESKTKKQNNILFRATTRATNYISRMLGSAGGCGAVGGSSYWPCAAAFLLLVVFAASSLLFTSRGFVCISSYDPVSRAGFFGLDGLESDFGTLGVPWCKSLSSDLIPFRFDLRVSDFVLVQFSFGSRGKNENASLGVGSFWFLEYQTEMLGPPNVNHILRKFTFICLFLKKK